jgi:hypothetical protein
MRFRPNKHAINTTLPKHDSIAMSPAMTSLSVPAGSGLPVTKASSLEGKFVMIYRRANQ